MAAATFVPFLVFFSFSWVFVLANQDTQEETAKPRDNVTLQCIAASREDDVVFVMWRRPDQREPRDDFVFYSHRNHSHESYQLPSYCGRVELRDPEMKDGDASVVLKNVNINDAGTYECNIGFRYMLICRLVKPEVFSTIKLTVTDSELKVKAGDDVSLQCQGPRDNITALEWRRLDPRSAGSIFFFSRDERSHESLQLPSFRGRVELRDQEMKDGNASVVLRNVTVSDAGTYECRVSADREGVSHFITTLKVEDSDGRIWEGGNEEGGDEEGGNKEGGNKEGGNKQEKITEGLNKKGRNKEGGNQDGGNKEGGNKEGGNKDGGNKEGGNKEGGNKEGGNKDGGNKEGGNNEGGNEDGGTAEANSGGRVGLVAALSLGLILAAVVAAVVVAVVGFTRCRKYTVLTETSSY